MKYLSIICFLFLSQSVFSQALSAKVVDESNEPVVGATVYFDGTTVGVITDLEGVFNITKPLNLSEATLVIMMLGYETIYIKDVSKLQKTYRLKPKALSLDQVDVYDSPFSREEMLAVFNTYFLGTGKEARKCEILNPEDIILYFVVKDNTLYAKAANPIDVQNDYLGYKVRFDLKTFKIEYKTTTLDEKFLMESFYAGYSFFEDTNPKRDRVRHNVYFSSLNFFFRSLVNDNLDLTNFGVGFDGDLQNPKRVFDVKQMEENLYKVSLKHRELDISTGDFLPTTIILTHKYDVSNLLFKSPEIHVDGYGNNLDYDKIRLLGELSEFRIAKMLPTNFLPNKR